MAKLKVSVEVLAQLFFGYCDAEVTIGGATALHDQRAVEFEISGPDVPTSAEVTAICTNLRNRAGQSFTTMRFEAVQPTEQAISEGCPDSDALIDFLNSLVAVDECAIASLLASRVPCNEALANHPSVQVGATSAGLTRVGLLGILNGFCGVDERGYGPITAIYERGRLVRFSRTKAPK